MKNLFKIHLETIKKRGLITYQTTQRDYLKKIFEEYRELEETYWKDSTLDPQELMDIMCVCANALQYYGFDLEQELMKNINRQIDRI